MPTGGAVSSRTKLASSPCHLVLSLVPVLDVAVASSSTLAWPMLNLLPRVRFPCISTLHPIDCTNTLLIGGESLVRAFTREDFPEDPDQIFLTSWGEWWPKETIGNTLDKDLQDKWSWSKEEVEKMEGLTK